VTTQHDGIPLSVVVVVAIVFTAVLLGIGAVAEGAKDRLENRRLRRDLHKLETEINYLRTQPTTALGSQTPPQTRPTGPSSERETDGGPPSAPVYGNEDDEWSSGPDDDAYSGGRAV
jgi:hypothetical protein